MPISITGDGIYVGDGQGGMQRIEPTVTHIEIGVSGLEHIVIDDQNGIMIETDPETGMPIVHAESMTIASELKPKHFWQSWFRHKEKE
jgi:hypothetical protein